MSEQEIVIVMPFFLAAGVHEPQMQYQITLTIGFPGVAEVNREPTETPSVDQFLQDVLSVMNRLPRKVQIPFRLEIHWPCLLSQNKVDHFPSCTLPGVDRLITILVSFGSLRSVQILVSIWFNGDCVKSFSRQKILDILWERNFPIFVDTFQSLNK
jgi:hypothetical protein